MFGKLADMIVDVVTLPIDVADKLMDKLIGK